MKIRDARFLASASSNDSLPAPTFPEIAFAGRSNVGKSSLINGLLQRKKLVRTSNTPGATRAINVFRVELAEPDAVLDFVDLPGYGWAKRSKKERKSWGGLIDTFLRTRVGLRGVVVIADIRRGFEEDDFELLEFLEHAGQRAILVATKLDKLPASKRKPAVAAVTRTAGTRVHGFSATTGEGREVLLTTILRAAGVGE
jgi:GTP-binding protein